MGLVLLFAGIRWCGTIYTLRRVFDSELSCLTFTRGERKTDFFPSANNNVSNDCAIYIFIISEIKMKDVCQRPIAPARVNRTTDITGICCNLTT